MTNYTALARKWRPRCFDQLLGQDPIKTILINSLNQKRIHHAYLFTGTRGVGKTSVARLFAKSLSCERGISATPCLECDTCLSIEQGRFIDLIEVDGASRTRVEDTRELLENIQYTPTSGRFKIYLIDEVHMLSQHSFNALLKTLEEPPSHVKFLLATTDPQKLPVTILSRCLQFHLKHIAAETITEQLTIILNAEQMPFEPEALALIAKAARGSMRDALSLLDQAIAGCNETLNTNDVKQLLGYTKQDYAIQILEALSKLDVNALLTISQNIASEGGQFNYVLDELLNQLHRISIYQSVPNCGEFISDVSELIAIANAFTPEDTQLFYQIALKNREELELAPSPAIAFDMMLLRLYTFKPSLPTDRPVFAFEAVSQSNSDSNLVEPTNQESTIDPLLEMVHSSPLREKLPIMQEPDEAPSSRWDHLLPKLNLTGLTLNAAENAILLKKESNAITFQIDKRHASLFTTSVVKRLEDALSAYYNERTTIKLETTETPAATPAIAKHQNKELKQQGAEEALQNDPIFQQLQDTFSAKLIKNSIASQKDDL